MHGNTSYDPWTLESEEAQPNGEEVNLYQSKEGAGEPKPAEKKRDLWETESPFANIVVKNITPQTSPETRRKLTWQAIGYALVTYQTRAEIDRYVLGWNDKNDPKLDEQDFLRKIDWALINLPSKLRGTA